MRIIEKKTLYAALKTKNDKRIEALFTILVSEGFAEMRKIIIPDEVVIKRRSTIDIDPFHALTQKMINESMEKLKGCEHVFEPYHKKCLKCGDTELEVLKRLEVGIYDEFVDTYKNGKWILRERVKKN